MKKFGARTALLVLFCVVLGSPVLWAESSTSPPTDLKKVGDHWTAWDPPPAGPDAYLIEKGDTLWDLAEAWFSDPFLWPQIWDENRYILDSHWIYPGDPLVVPGRPTVVPTDDIPPSDISQADDGSGDGDGTGDGDGDGSGDEVARVEPLKPLPPPLVPMADSVDLYCSGHIEPAPQERALWIASHDKDGDLMGEADVIFLSHGSNAGVRPGAEYAVVRRLDTVAHPKTNDPVGTLFRSMGKVRIMLVHEESATAVIEMSCEDIADGDELVPWQDVPVPMLASMPTFDRWDPTPSGGASGHLIAFQDNLSVVGNGNLIYMDLGESDVAPGDIVTMFRSRGEALPRQNLGQAVILTVRPESSLAKVVLNVQESQVGDEVEAR